MARLIIAIDIDIDPARNDPHETAIDVLDDIDQGRHWPRLRSGADTIGTFVGAEWVENAGPLIGRP